MDPEPVKPQPLDYVTRTPNRRVTRCGIVTLFGAVTALVGTVVFARAHVLTDYDTLVAEHARLHELLWAAFGIALLLAGALVAAVGLQSWCKAEAR